MDERLFRSMKRTSLSQFKKTNQVIRSSKDFHAPSQTKTIKHPFPIYPKLQTRYIFIFLESILNQVDRVFFLQPLGNRVCFWHIASKNHNQFVTRKISNHIRPVFNLHVHESTYMFNLHYRVSHSKVWKVILLWWGYTYIWISFNIRGPMCS